MGDKMKRGGRLGEPLINGEITSKPGDSRGGRSKNGSRIFSQYFEG